MSFPKTATILIIGGGVIGASTAFHLANQGGKDILLLEKANSFGLGATSCCAGGVHPQFSTEVKVRLSNTSIPMLEQFEEEIGQPIDFRPCGYLFLLPTEREQEIFQRHVKMQRRLGVNVEHLDRESIQGWLPMMNLEDIYAGIYYPRAGVAKPYSVVMGYINAAHRMGVRIHTGVNVTGIKVKAGKINAVETNFGTISTPIVINSGGPEAGSIAEMAGVSIPLSTFKSQWFSASLATALPPDFPAIMDLKESLYLHPHNFEILTGRTNLDQPPGTDKVINRDWELDHAKKAIERLPMLEQAGLAFRKAGIYGSTPDDHPILGESSINGFYIAAGFSEHGFMHSPISGQLLTETILKGQAESIDISSLNARRFEL